jgi:hypothetical protein
MKMIWIIKYVPITVMWLAMCNALLAQEPNCDQVVAMANMARAKSADDLRTWKQKAGDSYRAHVVFAFRSFELKRSDHDLASSVLGLIPKSEEQDSILVSFNEALCQGESDSDILALDRLVIRIPRILSRAVLIVPEHMTDYISYAPISVLNPESDYAVQMITVCKAKHDEFLQSINKLSTADKRWFKSKIFNPDGCHALALPEAD